LADLKKSQKTDFVSPKYNYFEGKEEMRIMLKDVLLYDDLETELYWPVKDMIKVWAKIFLFEFNKKRVRNGIGIRVIWPQEKTSDVEKIFFWRRGGKFYVRCGWRQQALIFPWAIGLMAVRLCLCRRERRISGLSWKARIAPAFENAI